VKRFGEGRSAKVIYVGAGWSRFFVYGTDFPRFQNDGIKLVPFAYQQKWFSFVYNLRIFPDAFTAAQFGAPPSTTVTHQGREFVQGITVRILWGELPWRR
jgi:hypothetical protein